MENEYKASSLILNGLFAENPIFRLALSLCPAVAITTNVENGFMLGVAVLFVQVMSSITISIIKDYVNPRVRVPIFTFVIASWVSVTDMLMGAFAPPVLYEKIGLFIKLIVAFAIIISRLELFASKNPIKASFWDGFGMGLGFLFGMLLVSCIRELFGSGTILGYEILMDYPGFLFMILPAGGFFVIGFIMAFYNWIDRRYLGGSSSSGAGGAHG